jgi:cell wall-associated NlpC family hydrolase
MRGRALLLTTIVMCLAAPAAALGQDPTGGADADAQPPAPADSPAADARGTGGATYGKDPSAPPRILVAGTKAKRLGNGFAAAPAAAPRQVRQAIWAANEIVGRPYRYGGGHRAWMSAGYDCSGTVSYALHGGGLLASPLDSGRFMRWGMRGRGRWITVFTNRGHAYVVIAGLRLDTSSAGERRSSGEGPRWRTTSRSMRGFVARHPNGF